MENPEKRIPKSKHIHSENFSMMAYHYLKTVPKSKVLELNITEQKFFASEFKLSEFCQNESMDRILLMLTRVGFSWTFRIERNPEVSNELEQLLDAQNEFPAKVVDITEAAAREGTIVISSANTMFLSHMLSLYTHSMTYQLSPYINDLTERTKRWRGEFVKVDKIISNGGKTFDDFIQLLIEQMNSWEYSKASMNLTVPQIKIMMYLFLNRDKAVIMKDISLLLKNNKERVAYVKQSIIKLKADKIIIEHNPKVDYGVAYGTNSDRMNDRYYMLSTKGVGMVVEYMKFIHGRAFKNK